MPDLPVLRLVPRGTHRVLAGHLWVYRNEVDGLGAIEPGALVELRDAGRRFVAICYANPRSQIALRVLSRTPRAIDGGWWRERIGAAVAHRARTMPGAEAFRVVHAEADLLPGLIVDRYGGCVVVQITTAGIEARRAEVVAAVAELLRPEVLVERSDVPVRRLEGLEERSGIVEGALQGPLELRIGAGRFAVDPLDPHKTGAYLDQQANYGHVASFVRPGERVLDAFCHQGGFGIHAAIAGAGAVDAIDSAEASVAAARRAAILSGVADRLEVTRGNAFDLLRAWEGEGRRYDVIVLDPPTFTRSRGGAEGAWRGYKELHLRALRMLGPGGRLATFSCSHHVSADDFLANLRAAAADVGASLRVEARLGAAPDHPVLVAHPETEYLKGFVATVLAP